jgi:hypothetical protein
LEQGHVNPLRTFPPQMPHPQNSLKDSNVSSKVKTNEEKEVGIHSLVCSISGVKGEC